MTEKNHHRSALKRSDGRRPESRKRQNNAKNERDTTGYPEERRDSASRSSDVQSSTRGKTRSSDTPSSIRGINRSSDIQSPKRSNTRSSDSRNKKSSSDVPMRTRSGKRRPDADYRRPVRSRRHRKSGLSLISAYLMRILFLAALLAVIIFAVKGIAGIFFRAEAETKEQTVASSGEESVEISEESVSEEDTTEANPNLIQSNGRTLDITKPMVALTFDDGPYPEVGNAIMDEMDKVDGRATFFLVGTRVPGYATEVRRMATEGHEIANHSFDHDESLSKKGAAYVAEEFQKCNSVIEEICGVRPTVLRLPGGIISNAVRQGVPMPMFHWSVDTKDWKTRNIQSTIDSVIGHVQDGDIVLMHELYPSTGEACRTIIPRLAEQGFQLVTISELYNLKASDVQLKLDRQYTDFRPETVAKLRAEQAAQTAAQPVETASADAASDSVSNAGETSSADGSAAASAGSEADAAPTGTKSGAEAADGSSSNTKKGPAVASYAYSGNTSIKLYGS